MQGLIVQREALARERRIAEREAEEAYERDLFTRERRSLDAIMWTEEAQGLFDPPRPKQLPPPYIPPTPVPHVPVASPHQTVEPWFDPARMPTPSDLRCIAQYALGYLGAIRPHPPCLDAGHQRSACDLRQGRRRDRRGNAEPIPCHPSHGAALDLPAGLPKDLLGASLAIAFGAMRVVSLAEGQQVSIEVTYD